MTQPFDFTPQTIFQIHLSQHQPMSLSNIFISSPMKNDWMNNIAFWRNYHYNLKWSFTFFEISAFLTSPTELLKSSFFLPFYDHIRFLCKVEIYNLQFFWNHTFSSLTTSGDTFCTLQNISSILFKIPQSLHQLFDATQVAYNS